MNEVFKAVTAVHAGVPAAAVDAGSTYGPAGGAAQRQPAGGKNVPGGDRGGAQISATAATQMINAYLRRMDRGLRFHVDEGSGKTVIKVVDNRTREVVRQIPPEVVLRLAERLQRYGRLDTTGLESRA